MFKDVFSFQGRIRRTEYGLSLIFYFIAYMVSYGLMIWSIATSDFGLFFSVLSLFPLVWFMLAQAAKRCHDMGKSGWWQLIPLYAFIILFMEGDKGSNSYGTDPKQVQ